MAKDRKVLFCKSFKDVGKYNGQKCKQKKGGDSPALECQLCQHRN